MTYFSTFLVPDLLCLLLVIVDNLIFTYFIKYSIHETLVIVNAIINTVTTVLNTIVRTEGL